MERVTVTVERRSARAILIDDEGRLVLIKRSKPDREPYWTTAGGGVVSVGTNSTVDEPFTSRDACFTCR